jgi:predicted aspartyl protease
VITYDAKYDPPAPIVQVTLFSTRNRRLRRTCSAILDTGADITAIPEVYLEQLQLYPIRQLQFEDWGGITATTLTYKIRLSLDELTIQQLEVVLTGLDFVVIGRDVLNRLNLHFYGLQQLFQIELAD